MIEQHGAPDQLLLPFEPRLGPAPRRSALGDLVDSDLMDDLHLRLARQLGEPIDLIGTRNRRTIISWRRADGGLLRVRCLRQFALAGDDVVAALARFIKTRDPEARAEIQAFSARVRAPSAAPRRPRFAPPLGRHHDLRRYFEEENRERFESVFRARIGWSLGSRGLQRRSIRLGSWAPEHRLIKVHPVLDRPAVPEYVVGFVVFHEMLHGVVGGTRTGERTVFHTQEFRDLEQGHPDYGRAQTWIAGNLDALLAY